VQDGDDRLAGLLGGDPLDGQGDDLAGSLLALRPGLVLDVPDDERRFALGLVLYRGDELGLGLVRRQPGYALELLAPVGVQLVQLGGPPVEFLPALAEDLGAVLDALELLVEPLLAVGEAGFPALEVATQLANLVLDRADLFLDLAAALGGLLGFLAGSLEDPAGPGRGCARLRRWRCPAGRGPRCQPGASACPRCGATRRRPRMPPRATRSP
jgi:hypothetical protein